MTEKKQLHERLRDVVPTDKWATLDEICSMVGSTAKSYVKVTLSAMPDIAWRRSSLMPRYDTNLKNRWYWEFKRITDDE